MLTMGWFGVVRGLPRLSETKPFDSAHMTSYLALIENMHILTTISIPWNVPQPLRVQIRYQLHTAGSGQVGNQECPYC